MTGWSHDGPEEPMDCSTVHQLIGDAQSSGLIAAHLQQCVTCRAEAELHLRMASAVAALPRLPAPGTLAGRVMAEVRTAAAARAPARRLPRLLLRPWEVGWIAAASLLLVALIPLFQARWTGPLMGPADAALRASNEILLPTVREWGDLKLDFTGMIRELHSAAVTAGGVPAVWLLALIGFGVALVWLLARHAEIGHRPGWEDVHA